MRSIPGILRPTHDLPLTLDTELRPPVSAESRYLHVPVELPCGVVIRLDVEITCDRGPDSLVDIGLFDPRAGASPTQEGFRGWSGGARDSPFLGPGVATPGYVAEEIALSGRGEIQVRANRKQLLENVFAAFSTNEPPRGLNGMSTEQEPVRRALSNPICFGNWNR